ncbi:MAG: monofunctional biosynthetic peptidoglycan transglycosylase [Rhodobiaceae bacterium]|nr:monofunctional biosynthetic peptidoglycan transglycosylase [Rhodobiaceae bacterium]
MADTGRKQAQRRGPIGRLVRFAVRLVLWLVVALAVLVVVYRFVNPPVSALMLWRMASGQSVDYHWVPLADISDQMPLAVITSEDSRFCDHGGVDWNAVEIALDESRRGGPRGASTITMQTVKNLFLWPSRSYVRKGLELPLALYADLVWSKRRTIELYLNIAEWGPGIFGIGAAAKHHFNTTPDKLTRQQAAQLAASLPNPFDRDAGKPGPQTRRIARVIERRMVRARPSTACLDR